MKASPTWWEAALALDFLDERFDRFLSTLALTTTISLRRLLNVVALTVVSIVAMLLAIAFAVKATSAGYEVAFVVTTFDLAVFGVVIAMSGCGWSVFVLVCVIDACWRKARRSPIGAQQADNPRTTSTQSLDDLRAYAAERRDEALRDHQIVTDAVNTMAKEIFK